MSTISLGTTNPGKVREFAALLAPMGLKLEVVGLDVPERGDTFDDNARQKALAYGAHTGGVTISEDSGLVIPALGGLPGAFSARFSDVEFDDDFKVTAVHESGRERSEQDRLNNQRVLDLMAEVPQPKRAAVFKVRLVVVRGEAILFEASGEAHGWIAEEARGEAGFGYDPIFVGQDTFGRTYAELDPVRKNLRSHRKRLLKELGHWLAKALREGEL